MPRLSSKLRKIMAAPGEKAMEGPMDYRVQCVVDEDLSKAVESYADALAAEAGRNAVTMRSVATRDLLKRGLASVLAEADAAE
jgi:hypothetical protein